MKSTADIEGPYRYSLLVETLARRALCKVIDDPLVVPKAPRRRLRGVRVIADWPHQPRLSFGHPRLLGAAVERRAQERLANPWLHYAEPPLTRTISSLTASGPGATELDRYLVRVCRAHGITREDLTLVREQPRINER